MPAQYSRAVARFKRMDDLNWRRYANPLSVQIRIWAMPAMLISAWSFQWIGAWGWFPLLTALVLTAWNPRGFRPVKPRDSWAARATFGERLWLNDDNVPVPTRHDRMAKALVALIIASVAGAIVGIAMADVWITAAGTLVALISKIFFYNLMNQIYEEMADLSPDYRAWMR